jgi:hypothetical protein
LTKAPWLNEPYEEKLLAMTYLQRSLLLISIALAILLAGLILQSAPKQADTIPVPDVELDFNPDSAYEMTKELVTAHPERAMGTESSKDAAEWIADKMKQFRLQTEIQEFSAWVHGNLAKGRNVVGIDNGFQERAIVLLAHYDIPFHVREGAMDDASGVGVLLELARVFSRKNQEKTLVFVATDGEEWGMLGARHFLNSHQAPDRIFSAISLDYVRVEDSEKIYLRGEGQFREYAPQWLWVLSEDCIRKTGGIPMSPRPLMHYVNRAVNICSTDQGPFVTAGIPAINLGGNKSSSPLARKIYHTQMDTHENLSPALFSHYGKAAELLVRSLDGLNYRPEVERYYLPLTGKSYLGKFFLLALQIFLFFPLFLATLFQYYNIRLKNDFMPVVLLEALNFGLFLLPWMVSVIVLRLLVGLNYIPRFELYPATPLDPFLYKPLWGPIAITTAVFLGSWALVVVVRQFVPILRRADFSVTKAVGLDILLSVSILAFILNGFAATFFLAPAALSWIWVERRRDAFRLSLNPLLIIAGTIPFILLVVSFSSSLKLGWFVLWYMFLGIAYNFFSPAAVFIAIAVATVGGRLLQQSLLEKPEAQVEIEKDELQETHI